MRRCALAGSGATGGAAGSGKGEGAWGEGFGTRATGAGAVVAAATSGVARSRLRKLRRSLGCLKEVGRAWAETLAVSNGMGAPGSGVEEGRGASSNVGFVPDDGKFTMNVSGGRDLEWRLGSLRRGSPEDFDRRGSPGLETERTMASSDEQKDWATDGTGAPLEEAAREALLRENRAEVPTAAEPSGTQVHEIFLEGGMKVVGGVVYWRNRSSLDG